MDAPVELVERRLALRLRRGHQRRCASPPFLTFNGPTLRCCLTDDGRDRGDRDDRAQASVRRSRHRTLRHLDDVCGRAAARSGQRVQLHARLVRLPFGLGSGVLDDDGKVTGCDQVEHATDDDSHRQEVRFGDLLDSLVCCRRDACDQAVLRSRLPRCHGPNSRPSYIMCQTSDGAKANRLTSVRPATVCQLTDQIHISPGRLAGTGAYAEQTRT